MMQHEYQHIGVWNVGPVVHVRLQRPEVHNAFNSELIRELTVVFEGLSRMETGQVQAVVLSGDGPSFCAGADVQWMRGSLDFTREENVADATRMADMFSAVDHCPIAVIGRVHGAALGGGAGLVAVCDIVIAEEGTRFAFSETRLGIAPAVISPYVLRKIGPGHARALFLTAERFTAERAQQIGLVHKVVPASHLDAAVDQTLSDLLSSSPFAIEKAKALIASVPGLAPEEALNTTVQTIAALRISPSGQEGLRAFLEKRKPDWSS